MNEVYGRHYFVVLEKTELDKILILVQTVMFAEQIPNLKEVLLHL